MKSFLSLIAWLCIAAVIVYAAAQPGGGVVYQSPMGALGIGLIGMGLCKKLSQRRRAA